MSEGSRSRSSWRYRYSEILLRKQRGRSDQGFSILVTKAVPAASWFAARSPVCVVTRTAPGRGASERPNTRMEPTAPD